MGSGCQVDCRVEVEGVANRSEVEGELSGQLEGSKSRSKMNYNVLIWVGGETSIDGDGVMVGLKEKGVWGR